MDIDSKDAYLNAYGQLSDTLREFSRQSPENRLLTSATLEEAIAGTESKWKVPYYTATKSLIQYDYELGLKPQFPKEEQRSANSRPGWMDLEPTKKYLSVELAEFAEKDPHKRKLALELIVDAKRGNQNSLMMEVYKIAEGRIRGELSSGKTDTNINAVDLYLSKAEIPRDKLKTVVATSSEQIPDEFFDQQEIEADAQEELIENDSQRNFNRKKSRDFGM